MVKPAKRSGNAAWGEATRAEHRWPASLAVVVAIVLYVTLPDRFVLGSHWLFPVLIAVFLVPLTLLDPKRQADDAQILRWASFALIALVNAANIVSLVLLVHDLLLHGQPSHVQHGQAGKTLISSSIQIWVTNVIVFALWYWELDRGGPGQRSIADHREPDFLFPQMANPACAPKMWAPSFLDYVYVSFTNATAFSPTDTMPLTPWSKALMLIQSSASLLTVLLVAARAVNILGS